MLLSVYQTTEIIFGTVFFIFFYYAYLVILGDSIKLWDVIWCTFTLFIILSLRHLIINYQLLQEQNTSVQMNII
jgi:membrane protein implicated in regulation of membrane protease activity